MAEFRCNPSLTCISTNSNEKSLSVPSEKEKQRNTKLYTYICVWNTPFMLPVGDHKTLYSFLMCMQWRVRYYTIICNGSNSFICHVWPWRLKHPLVSFPRGRSHSTCSARPPKRRPFFACTCAVSDGRGQKNSTKTSPSHYPTLNTHFSCISHRPHAVKHRHRTEAVSGSRADCYC